MNVIKFMSATQGYRSCSLARRLSAASINFFCLGALNLVFYQIQPLANNRIYIYIVCLLGVCFFCAFPESPGKRILSISILCSQGKLTTLTRLFRASPYCLLFVAMAIQSLAAGVMLNVVGSLLYLASLLFILANSLSVLTSSGNLSLLDWRLCTQVVVSENVKRGIP